MNNLEKLKAKWITHPRYQSNNAIQIELRKFENIRMEKAIDEAFKLGQNDATNEIAQRLMKALDKKIENVSDKEVDEAHKLLEFEQQIRADVLKDVEKTIFKGTKNMDADNFIQINKNLEELKKKMIQ